jgi:putative transport protein
VGHGLFLNAVFRAGEEIPHGPETVLRKGDILRVTGSTWRLKILERETGRVLRPSLSTDIVTLALGLTAGALLGMVTIPLGSIKITLGSAVGLLLVGIVLSTLRTRYPLFGGPYPEPARRLIEDLGLNVFVAIVGLNAGAGVIKAVSQGSMTPIVAGTLLVGFVPAIAAWFIGRGLLHMNSALLMGAVAGGRCNSAGMQAAMETTQSNVPALSYPVTFAISNILLTLLAYVMAMVG